MCCCRTTGFPIWENLGLDPKSVCLSVARLCETCTKFGGHLGFTLHRMFQKVNVLSPDNDKLYGINDLLDPENIALDTKINIIITNKEVTEIYDRRSNVPQRCQSGRTLLIPAQDLP